MFWLAIVAKRLPRRRWGGRSRKAARLKHDWQLRTNIESRSSICSAFVKRVRGGVAILLDIAGVGSRVSMVCVCRCR